jgi:hypothetical protein
MNRYTKKEDAKIGDRIMFDNKTGFFKDLLKIKIIGEVIDIETEGNDISVSFKLNGKDPIIKEIPYFLCQ